MRRRDGLQNGAAIGFATTALLTCIPAATDDAAAQCGLGAVVLGGLGAGVGMLIDAAIRRRTVVFRAVDRPVTAVGWPAGGGAGVGLMVRW